MYVMLDTSHELTTASAVKSVHPRSNAVRAPGTRNMGEALLQLADALAIHTILRKLVVHIYHCENWTPKKVHLKADLQWSSIKLLGMSSRWLIAELFNEHRQQSFVSRMGQAKHSLMQESEHADVTSQRWRCKIEIDKCRLKIVLFQLK